MRRAFLSLLVLLPVYAQEQFVPVTPNLQVQGIPPIPVEVAERLAQYTESRSATLVDWHPTRREILILTRFANTAQVHQVAMPGGARRQLTFHRERVSGASWQRRTGETLVVSRDTGGGEFYQLWAQDPKTGRSLLLTDGKSRNVSPVWSPDGKRIVYSSTRRNGTDWDIWVGEPSGPGSAVMLAEMQGVGWAPEDWSEDGRFVLVSQYTSVNQCEYYVVDARTGERRRATPASARPVYWGSARFTPDGKALYLVTDQDSNYLRLARLELESGQLTFLRPGQKLDTQELALSEDGRYLAYTLNDSGAGILHVLETATGRERALPALPYGVVANLVWHSNSRELAFNVSSANSPSDVYSIDVTRGSLERWTESETGGMDTSGFRRPELVSWKSFDGRTITGFLYAPPQRFAGRRPVVINIHGGPESQSRPGFLGATSNYLVNDLGVAVILPNVRGSTGFGKEFVNLDNGRNREDSVRDIGALLDWIAAREDLDAGRVMVTGGSYGGYMTLASMVHYNDRLRCGLDVVGISNWVTFLENTEAYRRDLRRAEYGDEREPAMRDFLLSISPANHAARITKPLFIVQGRNDPRVPHTESEQMVRAIRENGGNVWYLLADDEGHGFAKKSNIDFQAAATIMFVNEFLLN